jgi:hypothetical protein
MQPRVKNLNIEVLIAALARPLPRNDVISNNCQIGFVSFAQTLKRTLEQRGVLLRCHPLSGHLQARNCGPLAEESVNDAQYQRTALSCKKGVGCVEFHLGSEVMAIFLLILTSRIEGSGGAAY